MSKKDVLHLLLSLLEHSSATVGETCEDGCCGGTQVVDYKMFIQAIREELAMESRP